MREYTNAQMQARTKVRPRRAPSGMGAFVHLCIRAVAVTTCAVALSSCARARATSVQSLPPLEVPAPPPRLVLPIQTQADVEPPPAVPTEEPRRPQPVPARPRATPQADPPQVVEEPRPPATAPAPPPPATALQTTPAAEQGEVERGIRATMSRATGELNKIDYRVLNVDARSQYDTAKRFVQQADDAIRMKNLPFAKNLADKAAALAAQLGQR